MEIFLTARKSITLVIIELTRRQQAPWRQQASWRQQAPWRQHTPWRQQAPRRQQVAPWWLQQRRAPWRHYWWRQLSPGTTKHWWINSFVYSINKPTLAVLVQYSLGICRCLLFAAAKHLSYAIQNLWRVTSRLSDYDWHPYRAAEEHINTWCAL